MRRIALLTSTVLLLYVAPTLSEAQNAPSAPPAGPEAQTCAALTTLNLEGTPGGPAVITSARLFEVPVGGLERWTLTPSGFGDALEKSAGRIHEYCDVTGYVASQNKFELKLPLPSDWNQKFFFYAC